MPARWQQKLTRYPIRDKHGAEIVTLHDARAYMLQLPPGVGERRHWQYAAKLLLEAAEGGDTAAFTDQLTLALLLDGRLSMKE